MDVNECKEMHIIHGPELNYEETRGVGELVFEAMEKYKDRICQVSAENGEEETFECFNKRSIRVALSMRNKGLKPGDMISICSYNNMDTGVTYIAGSYLNVLMSFLDPTLSVSTTIHLLKIAKPKLVFCGPEAVQLIETALQEVNVTSTIVVYSDSTPHVKFSEFLITQPEEIERNFLPVKVASCKETFVVLFSSGTTGYPKGLCIPHINMMYTTARMQKMKFEISIITYFTSLYWSTASHFFILSLVMGCKRIVVPRFDVKTALKVLQDFKVDYVFMANAFIPMLNLQPHESYDLRCLKHIACGGSIMTSEQVRMGQKMFPNGTLLYSWGMTETGYVTVFDPFHEQFMIETKIGSVGKLAHGLSAKVVDVATNLSVGPCVPGEWRLKGDCLLNGYYNQDSSEAWDEDGWLRTGDLGYYDEDECIYLSGRYKELIKYQSWHVAPAMLEEEILKHPKVQETVVFGLQDDLDGEHPAALVVLTPNCEQITPQEIVDFISARMHDREKLRGGVKFVQKIPKTPTGKVLRYVIKNMWLNNEL